MSDNREGIDTILSSVSIEVEVAKYIQLKPRSGGYVGLCPFHREKTPSFSVNPRRGFFYCFGCHERGDVISFVMKIRQLSFRAALELIASENSITLPSFAPKEHDKSKELTALFRTLTLRAREDLLVHTPAVDYLNKRGIDLERCKNYHIGYAGASFEDALQSSMRNDPELIAQAGLLSRTQRSLFARRILFPIQNDQGKVIGFGSRTLEADSVPKYINSSESPVFKKKSTLYGLYQFKKQKQHDMLIVEGYMDVVVLSQHAIHNTVATLGTAFTQQHWKKMRHYAKRFYFCMDGDQAGQKAQFAALKILLPHLTPQSEVYFITLPEGEDPDSFLQKHGREKFLQQLKHATAWHATLIKFLTQGQNIHDISQRMHILDEGRSLLNLMQNQAMREVMLSELYHVLELPNHTDLKKQTPLSPTPNKPSERTAKQPIEPNDAKVYRQRQKDLLKLVFQQLIAKTQIQHTPIIQRFDNLEHREEIEMLNTFLTTLSNTPSSTGLDLIEQMRGSALYSRLQQLEQESFSPKLLDWRLLKLAITKLDVEIKTLLLNPKQDLNLEHPYPEHAALLQACIQRKKNLEKRLLTLDN